jgi:hypothetical protein
VSAALAGAADTLLTSLGPAERDQLVTLLAKVAAHWQQLTAAHPGAGRGPAPILIFLDSYISE